ncbi:MAG TPA: RcnB family protein [Caulobacteraceae bacterium]|jgi:Ni/Co efflux regulator RcnB|nr:RcnB family protein [Caulobacteraceae bacterium]
MKTLLIAAAALSVLGATAASAQPYGQNRGYDPDARYSQAPNGQYNRDNNGQYRRDNNGQYLRNDNRGRPQAEGRHDNGLHRGWAKGDHLPRNYWTRQYVVNDWRARHLRQPPRGYQWRQVDNDYVLASVATGLIASIIAGR